MEQMVGAGVVETVNPIPLKDMLVGINHPMVARVLGTFRLHRNLW